jgi:hypothetical protein
MNRRVEQVLRDHFPTMTDDQLERMKSDDSGGYHDAFGDEMVWMSPKMIYRLLRDLSDEYEEELSITAEAADWMCGS